MHACFVFLVICRTFKANGVLIAAQIVISAGAGWARAQPDTWDEEDPSYMLPMAAKPAPPLPPGAPRLLLKGYYTSFVFSCESLSGAVEENICSIVELCRIAL